MIEIPRKKIEIEIVIWKIKLRSKKIEMLDHVKMNTPGQETFRTVAESVKRAVQLCNPIKNLPTSSYDKWKNMILNFNPEEMLKAE